MRSQKLLDSQLTGTSRTAASGSVSLSPWSEGREYHQITVTVAGGTADISVRAGIGSRVGVLHQATGVGETGVAFAGIDQPWPNLEVHWSSNTGTVAIDAQLVAG